MIEPIACQLPVPQVERFDIYHEIHKALRACMCATLTQVARLDIGDRQDLAETMAQLRDMLDFCDGHIVHEDKFIHSAMEARQPGSAAATAGEHPQHAAHLAELRALCAMVEDQGSHDSRARHGAWRRLQHALAAFVAQNLEHMEFEESHNNAVLQSAYSDPELMALHGALVSSLAPEEMAQSARWLMIGLSPAERLILLRGMQAAAPAPAFEAILGIARANLDHRDWAKLQAGLAEPLAA